jgi:hypothetical protein
VTSPVDIAAGDAFFDAVWAGDVVEEGITAPLPSGKFGLNRNLLET